MIKFLHTFHPNPILISIGPIRIFWYGFFIVIGIVLAIMLALKLAEYYMLPKNPIIDMAFWLIIFGILGARIYHIFLEFPFYLKHPLDMIKVWQGGLAIHGAIIAGTIVIWLFIKKYKLNFWKLTSITVPGLALGQAIGRWGNYFNQELFGLPTNASWGIPIDILHRPSNYLLQEYFHPTFIYESLGNLSIFIILISVHIWIVKNKKTDKLLHYILPTAIYLVLYSILRFSLEFIRIDRTPEVFGLRWPQIASLIIVIITIIVIFNIFKKNKLNNISDNLEKNK